MSELRYLRIPTRKAYELHDIFTRLDEEMAEIIRGLDMIISLLHDMRSVFVAQPPAIREVREVVRQVQVPAAPGAVGEMFRERVLMLPLLGFDMITTFDAEAPPDKYAEVRLHGEVVVMTPDDVVLVAGRPDAPGFPLHAGVYMVLSRTERLASIYVKSATGSAVKVHFMVLEVLEEGRRT